MTLIEVGEELSGRALGLALAPFTGLLSAARRARMFHPNGVLCSARAEPLVSSGPARDVAERLAGPVLIRWSSAWWKHVEWVDAFGCALRFTGEPFGTEPQPGDQDLLLATIQRPWTLPFAPLTTNHRDFLANVYYGVSPFEVPPLGRIEWRLCARQPAPGIGPRRERLARAIAQDRAVVVLEWSPYPGPFERPVAARFAPLLEIRLTGEVELDQRALRFDPFRAGRDVQPVGFVHALRRSTYRASQALRPMGVPSKDASAAPAHLSFTDRPMWRHSRLEPMNELRNGGGRAE
jgi:hypothetical protein